MKDMQKLLSYVRKAADDYKMINEGDRIAVGVSAGKDSLTLLCALAEMRRFYPAKYTLTAITLDMGFPGADFSPVAKLCAELDVEYNVVPTQIYKIIFEVRKEENPCSLCARMRRGALNEAAKAAGFNKVALGHNFDDVVETVMLNLFYEGRFGSFAPVTYLDRTGMTVIRPLIYAPESFIRPFARKNELPVIPSGCPANGNTERQNIKELLMGLERENKGLRMRIFGALERGGVSGYTDDRG